MHSELAIRVPEAEAKALNPARRMKFAGIFRLHRKFAQRKLVSYQCAINPVPSQSRENIIVVRRESRFLLNAADGKTWRIMCQKNPDESVSFSKDNNVILQVIIRFIFRDRQMYLLCVTALYHQVFIKTLLRARYYMKL